jgi:hypothetical protein
MNKEEYQWEDDIGPLPRAPARLYFGRNNCWIEQLGISGWFKVARRGRKQPWVSLFSNLRIEQETPDDDILFVRVETTGQK